MKIIKKTLILISMILSFSFLISYLGGLNATFNENDVEAAPCFLECEKASKSADNDLSIFLVMGIDNAGWNSDVIMLVSVSKRLGKIGVLQIPRDTYVNIDQKSYHKINAIYSQGCRRAHNSGLDEQDIHRAGSYALAEFLQRSLGIKIDGFASVTTSGLCKIVDSIGGIDLNIPIDLSYDDNSQNLHIRLKAGKNHLSGDLAVKFVRCRQYANADYGRMSAQRMFLSAVFHKIKHEFSIKSAVELFKISYKNVNTDIELSKALTLARIGLAMDDDDINMENLIGKSVKVNGAYCEVLNRDITKEKISSCLFFDSLSHLQGEFDPDGVFRNAMDENINRLYCDKGYFMK